MAEQPKKTRKKQNQKKPKSESRLKLLGYFSVDGERTFLPNSSQLLYFNPPKNVEVAFDLDEGIESAVRRDQSFEEEGIDLLLEWLKLNYKKLKTNPSSDRYLQPKFICTRGTLSRIFSGQCLPNDEWIIYASKWKGSIYLCADKTKKAFENEQTDKFSSWGHKFEQYVLSASPDEAPDTSKPVIETAEFRCVYQRRIGKYPVLFSAVMKGVCSTTKLKDPLPLDKLKFIETKTNKVIEHAGHERSLRKFKFLRWWTQLYLTDSSKVWCGFRDQSGIVQKLKCYNVDELVEMSKDHWSPKACIDFCESFLSIISDKVVADCDQSIYRFEKIPNHGVNITELSSENQCGFIPPSYLEAF